jgi:hypothetical protein
LPHKGIDLTSVHAVNTAIAFLLCLLYDNTPASSEPVSNKTPEENARNEAIIARYQAGASIAQIAQEFGISKQRGSQIIHRKN